MLRHDMRHILRSLSLCVENNDREKALALIDQYASIVEEAALFRFCENDTINYVLSDFAERCKESGVAFHHTIEFGRHIPDELLFATLLSNALENALNAQKSMPEGQRSIKLQLRTREDKLLLSVENPFKNRPVFADDLPVGQAPGHGYGTQSIRYMTEKLGGNCQFAVKDGVFITRAII
jgi:sensor histidine kinase regulating citrate/malate metabolism